MTFRRGKLPQFNSTMNSTAKAKEYKTEGKKKKRLKKNKRLNCLQLRILNLHKVNK